MEYTIGTMGKDGVMLALEDSMQAAQMSRANDTLREVINKQAKLIASLKAEKATLSDEIKNKDMQITRYKKALKRYRNQQLEAYHKALTEQVKQREFSSTRVSSALSWMSIGMLFVGLLTWVLIALF